MSMQVLAESYRLDRLMPPPPHIYWFVIPMSPGIDCRCGVRGHGPLQRCTESLRRVYHIAAQADGPAAPVWLMSLFFLQKQ